MRGRRARVHGPIDRPLRGPRPAVASRAQRRRPKLAHRPASTRCARRANASASAPERAAARTSANSLSARWVVHARRPHARSAAAAGVRLARARSLRVRPRSFRCAGVDSTTGADSTASSGTRGGQTSRASSPRLPTRSTGAMAAVVRSGREGEVARTRGGRGSVGGHAWWAELRRKIVSNSPVVKSKRTHGEGACGIASTPHATPDAPLSQTALRARQRSARSRRDSGSLCSECAAGWAARAPERRVARSLRLGYRGVLSAESGAMRQRRRSARGEAYAMMRSCEPTRPRSVVRPRPAAAVPYVRRAW
ncbi:hypothetical protein B0H10DRAFT_71664 [Mycena sp. CBHHK59/15]|nr:hypothetical protein B0H10DRAFT_71664 [Mycena sp. CBHHK59/15]